MPVDPQFHDILASFKDMPSFADLPLEVLRTPAPANPHPTAVDSVIDRTITGPAGDLRLRIYRNGMGDALPVLVFMHGGGFVLGGLDTHDEFARKLTAEAGCVTVAVDYRLAPENPYPAAVEDCFTALQWTVANAAQLGGDPGRLVVIGDSAGGNLAAVLALRARDAGAPSLAGQVLIYPVVDLSGPMLPAPDGEFYILSPETRTFFNGAYLREASLARDPAVSPGLAADLSNLPPTLMITAEFDPLCNQGETMADRLSRANVTTTLTRYAGAIHGFATFPVPMQDCVLREIVTWLQSAGATATDSTQESIT